MSTEELKASLCDILPALTCDESGEWLNVQVEPKDLSEGAEVLRYDSDLCFDYLFNLTCVDWKTHLTMVYHLTSTQHRHTLVLKVKLDRANPQVETVCRIWKTAELLEREVRELFGVTFLHHPDPRNLILPDEWNGYPLRKDYEDPINMIKL